jgi:hypothetical protein
MKFSKEYSKLQYPIFTTIRQNYGYYKVGQTIGIDTPKQSFCAEIVSIRNIQLCHISETIALRDADCTTEELVLLMKKFYQSNANDLILITLMRME